MNFSPLSHALFPAVITGVPIRLLAMFLALTLAACSWLPDQKDKTKDWSAQQLYSEANQALKEGDYTNAVKYYELLEARYPFGPLAMQAQLDVAYAHYKDEEHDSAIAACDRFIKQSPRNPFVDYAYYLKGVVNFQRSGGFFDRFVPTDPSQRDAAFAQESFNAFSELLTKFPHSRYAEDARQRMLYLRDNIAKHEVHVARYYYRRGAYLAAATRANQVVENYPSTSAVGNALAVMIRSYRKLGLESLAQDAERVLALNQKSGKLAGEAPPASSSLSGKVWEYLEFDKD
ncbi:Outer membrane protein assembly factor BamD [Gammaproteobacteria bacterium]